MSAIQYPLGTIGERLGITRIISKTMDGEAWTFGYNAAGALVTMMPSAEYATMVLEKRAALVSLEFADVFKVDDDSDDNVLDDDAPRAGAPHPFEKLFSGTELRKTVEDCGWDAPMPAPLSKGSGAQPFLNPLGFSRSSIGYKLGVVRIEQEVVDGERYSTAYNAAGECVESLHITG